MAPVEMDDASGSSDDEIDNVQPVKTPWRCIWCPFEGDGRTTVRVNHFRNHHSKHIDLIWANQAASMVRFSRQSDGLFHCGELIANCTFSAQDPDQLKIHFIAHSMENRKLDTPNPFPLEDFQSSILVPSSIGVPIARSITITFQENEDGSWKCNQCGRTGIDKKSRRKHPMRYHSTSTAINWNDGAPAGNVLSDSTGRFHCPLPDNVCKKTFSQAKHLTRHFMAHSISLRPFAIPVVSQYPTTNLEPAELSEQPAKQSTTSRSEDHIEQLDKRSLNHQRGQSIIARLDQYFTELPNHLPLVIDSVLSVASSSKAPTNTDSLECVKLSASNNVSLDSKRQYPISTMSEREPKRRRSESVNHAFVIPAHAHDVSLPPNSPSRALLPSAMLPPTMTEVEELRQLCRDLLHRVQDLEQFKRATEAKAKTCPARASGQSQRVKALMANLDSCFTEMAASEREGMDM